MVKTGKGEKFIKQGEIKTSLQYAVPKDIKDQIEHIKLPFEHRYIVSSNSHDSVQKKYKINIVEYPNPRCIGLPIGGYQIDLSQEADQRYCSYLIHGFSDEGVKRIGEALEQLSHE